MIGSPGRTTRKSPSVSPQLASLLAGMLPMTSTISFPPFAVLEIISFAFSSSPIATKNHCSTARSSVARCLLNNLTTRPSVFCCIRVLWHARGEPSTRSKCHQRRHVSQASRSIMPLTRLKTEYIEEDGVRFLMADEVGNTVTCRVTHEALRDHA